MQDFELEEVPGWDPEDGITGVRHYTWLLFVFLVETGFHHVGQAGLKLLTSGDAPQPPKVLGLNHFQPCNISRVGRERRIAKKLNYKLVFRPSWKDAH